MSASKLVRVRHKDGGRPFLAYLAYWDIPQEAVWWRPRHFLWWKWEDWYWRYDLLIEVQQ